MSEETQKSFYVDMLTGKTVPTIQVSGMNLIMQAMFAGSKGNVRICTDMTKDEGTVIDKDKLIW